jgi:NAD(P)-dependent dehydrogenase (short-subunit alcohol dehydrogenase family)
MSVGGKIAVVTGGTGALGRAVIAAFLDAGIRVIVPYRKEGELEAVRSALGLASRDPLTGEILDLTNEQAVLAFFQRSASKGGLDVLVNVAGGFAGGQPVHETAWSIWQEQLDINLKTTVLSSRAAAARMVLQGSGAIINVSSRTATQSGKAYAAYAASKLAVLKLTDAMAEELKEAGVTVNAILPSTIDTEANRKAMPDADFGRWVRPEQIARVILFLAGPDARIISGAQIPVYGRA